MLPLLLRPVRRVVGALTLTVALISAVAVVAAENVMTLAPAATPSPAPRYVKPEAFAFARLVAPPPAADSLAGEADLAVVQHVQRERTPEQIAWAKATERDAIFNHAEIIGAWFSEARLPRTAAFFKALDGDLRAIDRAAKQPFLRRRPYDLDPAIELCVTRPTSTSYPSGTAIQAFVWAELLAEAFPQHRAALLTRARRVSWGRVIGGVHFPSDIMAGEKLAPAFLAAVRESAEFRADWEACRRELASSAGRP